MKFELEIGIQPHDEQKLRKVLEDFCYKQFIRQPVLRQTDVSGAMPLVEALDKYIELLVEELNETASIASTHGWKSSRVDVGEQMRNRIVELRRQ